MGKGSKDRRMEERATLKCIALKRITKIQRTDRVRKESEESKKWELRLYFWCGFLHLTGSWRHNFSLQSNRNVEKGNPSDTIHCKERLKLFLQSKYIGGRLVYPCVTKPAALFLFLRVRHVAHAWSNSAYFTVASRVCKRAYVYRKMLIKTPSGVQFERDHCASVRGRWCTQPFLFLRGYRWFHLTCSTFLRIAKPNHNNIISAEPCTKKPCTKQTRQCPEGTRDTLEHWGKYCSSLSHRLWRGSGRRLGIKVRTSMHKHWRCTTSEQTCARHRYRPTTLSEEPYWPGWGTNPMGARYRSTR